MAFWSRDQTQKERSSLESRPKRASGRNQYFSMFGPSATFALVATRANFGSADSMLGGGHTGQVCMPANSGPGMLQGDLSKGSILRLLHEIMTVMMM